MKTKINNFFIILKKMKTSDYVYLSVIFVFFIFVFILFLLSTNFILKNINKIFQIESPSTIQTLNMPNYLLTQKKLNLEISSTTDNTSNTILKDNTKTP